MARSDEIRFLAERGMGCEPPDEDGGIWLGPVGRSHWWFPDGDKRDKCPRPEECDWDPFTSEADCAALIRAIPEDKRQDYCIALSQIVHGCSVSASVDWWGMVTATPEQRSRAALKVLEL